MGTFYAPTCKTDCLQILCKFCKNWISVPNILHQLTLSLRCKYCKIHSCSIFPDAINSIRFLAASSGRERLQANDVSLLLRYSSWVLSRTLERAYRRPFLTVFGEFEPQNVVGHRVKKERPYISRILPGAFLRPIGTNFGLRVRLMDIINCAKFYRNRLRGLDSMSGQILTIPIGLRCRR